MLLAKNTQAGIQPQLNIKSFKNAFLADFFKDKMQRKI